MSNQHARVAPHSRESLEQLLTAFPGGFTAISDIVACREAAADLLRAAAAAPRPNPNVVVEDRMVPGPTGAPDVPIRLSGRRLSPACCPPSSTSMAAA